MRDANLELIKRLLFLKVWTADHWELVRLQAPDPPQTDDDWSSKHGPPAICVHTEAPAALLQELRLVP